MKSQKTMNLEALLRDLEKTKQEIEIKNREITVLQQCLQNAYNKPVGTKGIARDVAARKQAERAIIESEQRLLDIINFLPDATFVVDHQGKVIAWNKAIEKMTGVKAEDMLGKGNYEYALPFYGLRRPMLIDLVLSPDAVGRDEYLSVEAENNHLSAENVCPNIGVNGAILYGTASPLMDATGNIVGAIESIRDISERRIIEQALRKSEENFRTLAETAPVFICVMRGEEIVFVNQFVLINTGYDESDLRSMPPWGFIHPDYRSLVRMNPRGNLAVIQTTDRHQIKLITKDSRSIWLDLSVSRIDFNGQSCLLGVGVDISERKLAEDQIRYLSYHDKLTGIYNRAYFEHKLQDLDKPDSMPLSMVMGDLNGLKLINDAFGHEAGDRLLQDVAKVFQACCPPEYIIARWGGDEFVVLMPNTSEDRASQICENIKKACITLEGLPVQTSVSLGVSTKDSSDKSLEECAKEAEDRMYRTKMLENKSNRSSFISSLEKTLWVRSHETQAHTWRLRKLVGEIGQALSLPASEIQNLELLASLHDIGKIAIPNAILDKPGTLSEEEWELMKKHPEIGYRITLSSPELSSIAEAILAHHERWDGRGYPMGLRGTDIPLNARIVAIADAYDVMVSGRPYQKGKSKREALNEIRRCAGSQFDPYLAKLFIQLLYQEFTANDISQLHVIV